MHKSIKDAYLSALKRRFYLHSVWLGGSVYEIYHRVHRAVPMLGEKRVTTKFLISPKTLNGETKWLETANVIQKCVSRRNKFNMPTPVWEDHGWFNGR